MKKYGLVLLATLLTLTLISTSAWSASDSIVIALGSEPTTLDPQIREDGGERAINDNIYDTVLTRTPMGDLVPSLATAMPTLVDSTTWEIKLRPGIKFHNGETMNADAVRLQY